jgi:hypothetical protein
VTTNLITGMNFDQAVEAIRGAAEQRAVACAGLGFHTETGEKAVLIGVAQHEGTSFVMAVDRADYDWVKLATAFGFHDAQPPTATERTKRGKK